MCPYSRPVIIIANVLLSRPLLQIKRVCSCSLDFPSDILPYRKKVKGENLNEETEIVQNMF